MRRTTEKVTILSNGISDRGVLGHGNSLVGEGVIEQWRVGTGKRPPTCVGEPIGCLVGETAER